MSISCIFLGAPGSGKGTQAKRLQSQFKIPHISTGDMLRGEIAKNSPLGLRVKEILSAGKLVNDELMLEIIDTRLSSEDVQGGFLLDGFPRTIKQAEGLENIFKTKKIKFPKVVFIDLDQQELLARLTGRLSCLKCGSVFHKLTNPPKKENVCDSCGNTPLTQRPDDSEETARNRLKVYEHETAPLLQFYRTKGQLFRLNGNRSVDEVTKELISVLSSAP